MLEKTFVNKGVSINYWEGPAKGNPFLLLHGATKNWTSFNPIIPDLIKLFHVFACDFRGHGKSSWVESGYCLQHYIDDTHAFICKKMAESPIIMGHSLGGIIGIFLAAHYPQWVKKLILIDSPFSMNKLQALTEQHGDLAKHIVQLMQMRKSLNVTAFDHLIPQSLAACDPDMLQSVVHNFKTTFADYNIEELLPRIRCPVLLICGNPARGGLVSDNDIMKAKNLLPHFHAVRLDDVGHSPIQGNKEAVLKTVNQFLEHA